MIINLSPYEKNRVIPVNFGFTEMGRDLLAEDYVLKQITASLIYPEDFIGRKFWKRIYEEAQKKYGSTNIPLNTFNKVWIVPEKAVVYENANNDTAYIADSKLKVMLEQDYLSLVKHEGIQSLNTRNDKNGKVSKAINGVSTSKLGCQIVREIVIPELTKEVNENKNFNRLKQIYNSLILATWYKQRIKSSLLSEAYINQAKIAGVKINDPQEKQKIYDRYLKAFKKGVFNYIKEDVNPVTSEITPRKYFSGGVSLEGAFSISKQLKILPANQERMQTQLSNMFLFKRLYILVVSLSLVMGQKNQKYKPVKNEAVLEKSTLRAPVATLKELPGFILHKNDTWHIASKAMMADDRTLIELTKKTRIFGRIFLRKDQLIDIGRALSWIKEEDRLRLKIVILPFYTPQGVFLNLVSPVKGAKIKKTRIILLPLIRERKYFRWTLIHEITHVLLMGKGELIKRMGHS